MPDYFTYSNNSNISSFPAMFDYAGANMSSYVGADVMGPAFLMILFIGFYIVGSRYTQERAFLYSSFMTAISGFLLTSGHFLDPRWLLLPIFAFALAAYFAHRVD